MNASIRSTILAGLYGGVYHSGAFELLRRRNNARGRRITIVNFHRVADRAPDDPYALPTLFISREFFHRTLDFLRERYRIISLATLVLGLRGEVEIAENSLAITFDDGYRDVFENALPVLLQHGIPATVFIPTRLVESPAIFWWDECYSLLRGLCENGGGPGELVPVLNDAALGSDLQALPTGAFGPAMDAAIVRLVESLQGVSEDTREQLLALCRDLLGRRSMRNGGRNALADWPTIEAASRQGFAFGSHTQHHIFMDCEPEEVVRRELCESKADLEFRLKTPVTAFAYPGGRITPEARRWVAEAGYDCALTTEHGVNSTAEEPFDLKRVELWNGSVTGAGRSFSTAHLAFNLLGLR